jgi:hypothetical protein
VNLLLLLLQKFAFVFAAVDRAAVLPVATQVSVDCHLQA